ncbi:hypothetical protein D3C86_2252750 [compost metagenome]
MEDPFDLSVAQLNFLQVIVLFLGRVLDVVHFRSDMHKFHFLEQNAVVQDFLA